LGSGSAFENFGVLGSFAYLESSSLFEVIYGDHQRNLHKTYDFGFGNFIALP
jgi:hypothetical protein